MHNTKGEEEFCEVLLETGAMNRLADISSKVPVFTGSALTSQHHDTRALDERYVNHRVCSPEFEIDFQANVP